MNEGVKKYVVFCLVFLIFISLDAAFGSDVLLDTYNRCVKLQKDIDLMSVLRNYERGVASKESTIKMLETAKDKVCQELNLWHSMWVKNGYHKIESLGEFEGNVFDFFGARIGAINYVIDMIKVDAIRSDKVRYASLTALYLFGSQIRARKRLLDEIGKIKGFARVGPSSEPDTIVSRIDGVFEGWDGDTIFKLENGQIWQQSSYAYTYHYAYRPKVIIYRTSGGYKMKVEGVDETIYVIRLK